jgi:hypothetical protein
MFALSIGLTFMFLQLAFPDAIYLVDAIEGGKVLIEACKPALESDFVTKVIHDCKRDSEVSDLFDLFFSCHFLYLLKTFKFKKYFIDKKKFIEIKKIKLDLSTQQFPISPDDLSPYKHIIGF